MKFVTFALALSIAAPAAAQDVPKDLEGVVRRGLEAVLKDATSAELRLETVPRIGTATTKTASYSGWLVCGKLNAKNSYGAYVGSRDYLFVIDPASEKVTALDRLDRAFNNVDAWRQACYVDRVPLPTPAA